MVFADRVRCLKLSPPIHIFFFKSESADVPLIWNQTGQAIVGYVNESGFGALGALALSANGKTLVAGAPYANNKTGYVVVYTLDEDGGSWTQLGQTIYGMRTDDTFGDSVDISSDGKLLAIGSPGYIFNIDRPGYVQVYTLEISDGLGYMWKQLGQNCWGYRRALLEVKSIANL